MVLRSEWRLLDLGDLPPVSTQVVYHAVALEVDKQRSPNTVILCSPKDPLVCIGFHQELEMEVDTEYCQLKNLPIVRRILGGGAVYLDNNQLFYQIIAHRSDPVVPKSIEALFKKFLEAPVKTYNDIGIDAVYRPVNDIEVNSRKISGNGATEINSTVVLTGNMIFDFNFNEMTRILKVPSEKFRDKVAFSLGERLTTIKKELSDPPSRSHVKELLRRNYESTLETQLKDGELLLEELNLMESIGKEYASSEWLHSITNDHKSLIQRRNLKITGRSHIGEVVKKTKGGLLRVLIETLDNKIIDIMITGDFSFIPKDSLQALEKKLKGTELMNANLYDKIREFYTEYGIESPGMTYEDLTQAILDATSKRS